MTDTSRYLTIFSGILAVLAACLSGVFHARGQLTSAATIPHAVQISLVSLPQPQEGVRESWSTRSMFAADHSRYARPVLPPPPPVEAPPVEVRLIGVSRSGGSPVAVVMMNGVEYAVVVDDQTLIGAVLEIGLDYVVFDDGGPRRIGLFD